MGNEIIIEVISLIREIAQLELILDKVETLKQQGDPDHYIARIQRRTELIKILLDSRKKHTL